MIPAIQFRRLIPVIALAGCATSSKSPEVTKLEERVKKLEDGLAKREEALEFLDKAYAQQKQEIETQEANEPDPDAVFAVDISAPLQAGQVEGPNSALVTIVEAWDFA